MKTRFTLGRTQLFLEKRHLYNKSPEGKESAQSAPKSAQDIFREIEDAVNNLEQGKGEQEKLVGRLVDLLHDRSARNYFSPELLTALSGRKEEEIRLSVASNPNTPVATLVKLSGDKDVNVRQFVADNRHTPGNILAKLANDSMFVRVNVASNPNTPVAILVMLSGDDSKLGSMIRAMVAGNPSTPPDILTKLANSEYINHRIGVARNRNTPPEILAKLAKDADEDVKSHALENLKARDPKFKNEKK